MKWIRIEKWHPITMLAIWVIPMLVIWTILGSLTWQYYQYEISLALFAGYFNTIYFVIMSSFYMALFTLSWLRLREGIRKGDSDD